jgi:hypothetical protein
MSQESRQATNERLRRAAEEKYEKDKAECETAMAKFCRAIGATPAKGPIFEAEGGVFVEPVFVKEMPSGAEIYEYRLMQFQRRPQAGGGSQVLPACIVGSQGDTYPASEFVKLIEGWIRMYQAIDGNFQFSGARLKLTNEGWQRVPFKQEEA